MVTPFRGFDAAIRLEKKAPLSMENLSDNDLEILSKEEAKRDYSKLSDKALEYLVAKGEEKRKSFEPSTPKKVLDYGLDALGRGWEATRERAVSSGKMAEEGLKELFESPIDAEGNVDILPQLMGAGKAALGPLGIATAPGAGVAEMILPPEMPQDEDEAAPELFGKSPNEIRDMSKLATELLLPFPKSGKKPKFEPDNDLVNKLGGKINAEEKRFIDVYIRAMAKQGKNPTNDEIMEIVNVKFPNRNETVLHLGKEDEIIEHGLKESHIPEFSNLELQELTKAGIKFGDEDLADMMNMAQQLRDAGFGKDTFFSSTLGLSKIPQGVRPIKSSWLESLASFKATMMTSGVMTSIRNAEVTAQFFIVDAIDRALTATLRKAIPGGKAVTADELGASYTYLNDVLRTMNPAHKLKLSGDKILQILRARRGEVEKAMALLRKSHEVSVPNRVMAIASVLNNMQEYFFRRMAIEASLRSSLKAAGKNFDTIHPKDIPKKMLQDAFENGFRMTMAKGGVKELDQVSGRVTKGVLDHMESGDLGALFKLFVMPFPRFVFRNMLPFMRDFSPLGYFKAIDPKVLNKLAHGKPEEFAGIMSKAMIGSTLLGFGMAMRGSDEMSMVTTASGEKVRAKYYQWVRKDAQGREYTVDLRVISPTVGPYLYLAEQFLHPKNVTANDLLELTLGLRRWGALAMSVPYEFFTTGADPADTKHFANNMGKAIGEFIGSFTPQMVNSLVDISAGRFVPPEMVSFRSDAIIKSDHAAENFGNQMWATMLKNLPYFKTILAERNDPLDPKKGRLVDAILGKRGPLSKVTNALLKQLSGLRVEYTSPLRAEFKKLELPPTYGGSRTGVKLFDNMANELIARSLTSKGGLLDQMKSPEYRSIDSFKGKRAFISKHIYGRSGKKEGVAWEAYAQIIPKLAMEAWPRKGVGDPRAEEVLYQAMSSIASKLKDKGVLMDVLETLDMPMDTSRQNFLGKFLGQ